MIELVVFQDQSDFPLQIPINSHNDHLCTKEQKKDIHDINISHQANRQCVKVTVSSVLTWYRAVKPLFT